MDKFKFHLKSTNGRARTGVIETAHGPIKTPSFMPVGTRGSVKTMLPESLISTKSDVILSNSYHLMLKPGVEIIAKLGGLRKFMNWDGPILTDSGGFQVMSLSGFRKVTEAGVDFRSHLDGKRYLFSPEKSTDVQYLLDSTISMVFDECIPYPTSFERTKYSMELTSRWAQRSRKAFIKRPGYAQFGIIQGGMYEELRKKSVLDLVEMDFEGYAVGGLAVGEGQNIMFSVLDYVVDFLPEDKPRYLMGVGKPSDIIGAVQKGIDMFDCVIPTRSGRNGQAFTSYGTVNIRNRKYADDTSPLEYDCICPACSNYSKAYLHHTVRVGEIIGLILMTWHNIQYYQGLMSKIRNYITKKKEFDFNF